MWAVATITVATCCPLLLLLVVVVLRDRDVVGHAADMELGRWVTGSMGHLGHLSRRVTGSSF